MPQALVLEVGTGAIRVPIKVTAAQLRAGIKRHARVVGIQTEGKTDAQIGEAVLKKFLREVADNATRDSQQELVATYTVSIQDQVKAENELIDPEPPPMG